VEIVIKPEGDPSAVNLKGKGLISVAILSTATFDATDIDPETLLLGDEAGTDTPVAHQNNGSAYSFEEDVNDDGLLDLVVLFRVPELVDNGDLTGASTELVLRGFLDDGCTNFRGVDAVAVKP